MNQSVSYTYLLNIIIIFILVAFMVLMGTLSYTKAFRVNSKIANAIEIMLKKAISRVLIADNDNNLLGIVTRTDLINSITNLSQFPIITQ